MFTCIGLPTIVSSLMKDLFKSLAYLVNVLFVLELFTILINLYGVGTIPLSDILYYLQIY